MGLDYCSCCWNISSIKCLNNNFIFIDYKRKKNFLLEKYVEDYFIYLLFLQFCLLSVQQAFGLLFRDRFQQLGITSSEVTIILNVNLAMISFIGKVK